MNSSVFSKKRLGKLSGPTLILTTRLPQCSVIADGLIVFADEIDTLVIVGSFHNISWAYGDYETVSDIHLREI